MTKKEEIISYRSQGLSYNAIARKVEVSVGYVHIVCKEHALKEEIKALKLKVASD